MADPDKWKHLGESRWAYYRGEKKIELVEEMLRESSADFIDFALAYFKGQEAALLDASFSQGSLWNLQDDHLLLWDLLTELLKKKLEGLKLCETLCSEPISESFLLADKRLRIRCPFYGILRCPKALEHRKPRCRFMGQYSCLRFPHQDAASLDCLHCGKYEPEKGEDSGGERDPGD